MMTLYAHASVSEITLLEKLSNAGMLDQQKQPAIYLHSCVKMVGLNSHVGD